MEVCLRSVAGPGHPVDPFKRDGTHRAGATVVAWPSECRLVAPCERSIEAATWSLAHHSRDVTDSLGPAGGGPRDERSHVPGQPAGGFTGKLRPPKYEDQVGLTRKAVRSRR